MIDKRGKFWEDHAKRMEDPEYREAFSFEAFKIAAYDEAVNKAADALTTFYNWFSNEAASVLLTPEEATKVASICVEAASDVIEAKVIQNRYWKWYNQGYAAGLEEAEYDD